MSIETEVLVVGSGPGGYVAAIRGGQLGLDVTLVEAEAVGGVCLNRGCIPSKALISASDTAHEAANAADRGIHGELTVDLEEMVAWKDGVVDSLTGGVEQLCQANGVDVVHGRCEFENGETALIHSIENDDTRRVSFEYAILATGSRPASLPGFAFDGDHVVDSAAALSLSEVPDHLTVIGGGYIGMELSSVYAKLGADVVVIEMLDEILPGYEGDVTEVVSERAAELGVDVRTGERAERWEEAGGQVLVVTEDGNGAQQETRTDKILVAVGREPVTDTFGIESLGLETDEAGFLATDRRMRTEADGVFAIGDVAGEPMLAHKASREGEVAVEAIAGEDSRLSYHTVPEVVFTDPEIGVVGMTRDDAEAAGFDAAVGEFPFRASGRALTTASVHGFVRVVADEETGVLLGAQIVGPEASEMVGEAALAVETNVTVEEIASTIHAHPTLSEALMEAAADVRDRAIHHG